MVEIKAVMGSELLIAVQVPENLRTRSTTIRGYITAADGGHPLKTVHSPININGSAQFSLPKPSLPGTYTVSAEYAGQVFKADYIAE
jgi:hypothetical protein